MKHSPFTLFPLLMILGSAVQAQDDVTACSLIRIDQYYDLKEWDCRVPNTPVRISNVYTDKQGQQRVESISSQQNAMCDDQGICSNSGSFAGNAPAGSYHYTFGWYLGPDSKGNPVSYKSGTGPGFGGMYADAIPVATAAVPASTNVGQCVYPKTVPTKDGGLKFKQAVFISEGPNESANKVKLTNLSAFSVGAENSGYIKLLSVPDYDTPEPEKAAGKAIGWAKLSDFVFQDLQNCN